jgi:hypothetical protein
MCCVLYAVCLASYRCLSVCLSVCPANSISNSIYRRDWLLLVQQQKRGSRLTLKLNLESIKKPKKSSTSTTAAKDFSYDELSVMSPPSSPPPQATSPLALLRSPSTTSPLSPRRFTQTISHGGTVPKFYSTSSPRRSSATSPRNE